MDGATAAAVGELVGALERFVEADARARKAQAMAPLERALEATLAKAWQRQGAAFLRKLVLLRRRWTAAEADRSARNVLREAIREDDWQPFFDEAALETLELFEGPTRTYAARALEAGGRAAIAELALASDFDLANPAAVQYLEQHAAARVAGIHDVTRREIARIIADGARDRKSYGAIARAIKARFTAFAVGSPLEHIASRAELVAVTELGDAYEFGNRLVADGLRDAGLDMEKSWLDVGDRRVDPTCVSNAAEGWIPIDQPFGSGHQQPTAHPGCRCTCLYQRRSSPA